jgi:hypothetical protein
MFIGRRIKKGERRGNYSCHPFWRHPTDGWMDVWTEKRERDRVEGGRVWDQVKSEEKESYGQQCFQFELLIGHGEGYHEQQQEGNCAPEMSAGLLQIQIFHESNHLLFFQIRLYSIFQGGYINLFFLRS